MISKGLLSGGAIMVDVKNDEFVFEVKKGKEERRRSEVVEREKVEEKIIVGKGGSPLFIGTASELKTFFNPMFWFILDAWKKFRVGLPYNILDPDFIDILQLFQDHYEVNFSSNHVIIEYLGAIIKRLDSRRF
jgi:hypothetical protein